MPEGDEHGPTGVLSPFHLLSCEKANRGRKLVLTRVSVEKPWIWSDAFLTEYLHGEKPVPPDKILEVVEHTRQPAFGTFRRWP
jgi:hypothetical protein